MGKVNLNKLMEQSYELSGLIRATNGILNDPTPVSDLQYHYEAKVSDLASEIPRVAKMALATRRNPREVLIVGAVVGIGAAVGWVGATGIDAVRNGLAKAEAKKALMGYYEQLTVKQSLIIEEQQRIQKEMSEAIEHLSENEVIYRDKIRTLSKRMNELSDVLMRINQLRSYVEK